MMGSLVLLLLTICMQCLHTLIIATDYPTQLSFSHIICGLVVSVLWWQLHMQVFLWLEITILPKLQQLIRSCNTTQRCYYFTFKLGLYFLRFPQFWLYIHNDTMRALGRTQDMFSDTAIQLQPVFAQWVQSTHTLSTW